jgi:HlyD family secretion protein
MSKRKASLIAGAAALLVAVVAAPLVRHGDRIQYLTSKVQQGEIKDAVEATGVVNAVVNVQVGSQVSGTIAKLNADFNSHVHKGDVIALIDPRLFEGAVHQAAADLENAKANVVAAGASLSKARAALVQTKAEYDRAIAMMQKNIGTQQALDVAKANYDSARAAVEGAQASVVQANAQVSQKQAALGVAETNLAFTVIRSPIDGTVVARNVDVGQTVAASLQAPTIFTIAQDLVQMYLYAKVDESDVGRIRPGQQVSFKVDAFPKEVFRGKVAQIRMNPTTVQNVVTYDAVIEFENRELKLFPGMTAYVTIPVATVENVEKLPNAALRFKPPMAPEDVRALYARAGIAHDDSPVVWTLRGDAIEPVEVVLGLTDHSYTEVRRVVAGTLKPGDDVVTSAIGGPKPATPGTQGIRR